MARLQKDKRGRKEEIEKRKAEEERERRRVKDEAEMKSYGAVFAKTPKTAMESNKDRDPTKTAREYEEDFF